MHVLRSDEGEFNVGVQVGAQVFEGQLELLDALGLLDGEWDQFWVGGLVEKLLDALDFGVVQETQEEDVNFLWDFWFFSNIAIALVVEMLLKAFDAKLTLSHLDVYEWNNFRLEFVLWSFDNNNELLAHLWANLESDLFLKLFWHWVFNEPAVVLQLSICDFGSILVLEWQFFTIVLAKDLVAFIHFLFWNAHSDDLVFVADIGEQESWPKDLSANELAVVDHIWVNI